MSFVGWGILGLFCGTFLSATLLPLPSEALVIGTYELTPSFWLILSVATLGNFLGGLTNYWIGYKASTATLKKRFKLNETKIALWKTRLDKWGVYLGLISWTPFIGDPMVAVLGFFKVRFVPLAACMLVGKFLRYFVLLYLYAQATE